jgi:hypothetical protein
MSEAGWKDVAIDGRTSQKEIDDRLELEWALSIEPELEWVEAFQVADLPERAGSPEWVLGGGPYVFGDVVRWFVPGDEIESAETEVMHRLLIANERFRG